MNAQVTAVLLSLDDPRAKARWLRLTSLGAMYLFLASNSFSIAVNSISLGLTLGIKNVASTHPKGDG